VRLAHHVTRNPHVVRQRGENALRATGELVVELVGRLGRHHRHGGLRGTEAALDVSGVHGLSASFSAITYESCPGDERAAVERAGDRAADVAHHEAHGAADRQVRAPARAEEVVARVDVELVSDRAVDDHEHAGAGGGRARPMVAPARVRDALDGRDDDGHVLRPAPRHHRVDCDLLRRDGHGPVGDEADLLFWIEPRRLEHRPDALGRRRDDGQAVRPALLEAELDRVGDVLDLVALRRQRGGHRNLLALDATLPLERRAGKPGHPGAAARRARHRPSLTR